MALRLKLVGNDLNYRTEHNTTSTLIGTLKKGTVIEVITFFENKGSTPPWEPRTWVNFKLGSKNYWCALMGFEHYSENTEPSSPNPPSTGNEKPENNSPNIPESTEGTTSQIKHNVDARGNIDVTITPAKNPFPYLSYKSPEIPQTDDWKYLEGISKYNLYQNEDNTGIDTRKLTQINRFHLPTNDGVLGTKSFLFMTRPNLNLKPGKYKDVHDAVGRLPVFRYIHDLKPIGGPIFESLQFWGASDVLTPWLSIVTNQARTYTPVDSDIEAIERGETFHGHRVLYGKHNFKPTIAGTTSITFQDGRDLMVYHTLKVWREYIHAVSLGQLSPAETHIKNAELDYAVSLYYIVTKEDMEEIVYWEKLTGVFPLKVPDSIFEYSDDASVNLKYNIDFAFSMREIMNPIALIELDILYGREPLIPPISPLNKNYTQTFKDILANPPSSDAEVEAMYSEMYGSGDTRRMFLPNYIQSQMVHGVPYVYGPYITQDSPNTNKYKLRWV